MEDINLNKEEKEIAIKLRGITKTFGTVVANDQVNLDINYGEILALLGENGSGKTTLMNMLSGIYFPDGGTMEMDGKEVMVTSPLNAIDLGIGMIHQHFKLVEVFSALDNIIMGTKGKYRKKKVMKENVTKISEKFGLEMDLEKKVYNMAVSEKQTVEIMKVLYRGAKILILDEPTAVLTPQETKKLFAILRKMKEQGSAVIIITHKLNEVMDISDRVAILRKGQLIDVVKTDSTNENQLTELMVGRPVSLEIQRPLVEDRKTILNVVDLSVENEDKTMGLKEVSFKLRSGEILGVAGIAGSGQKELCEAIAGLIEVKEGAVLYNKKNIIGKTPDEIIKLGISMSFVPEDRLGMGLVGSMGMVDNVMLKSYKNKRGLFVDKKPSEKLAEELVEKLGIVTPGIETPVRMMSGGNVQKVLLGREIESKPNVLVTAYPVRGLDINSSYLIYDLLNEQKKKGVAILFVGEDLDVLLELTDKIMVLCHGELQGIVKSRETTKEEIGLMMTGHLKEGGDDHERENS